MNTDAETRYTHELFFLDMALLVLVIAYCIVAVYTGTQVSAQTETSPGSDCHTMFLSDAVPSGYGTPENLFSTSAGLMMRVTCEGDSVRAHVGNGLSTQYIYKYGYERINNKWERVTFTGADTKGPWVIGNATAKLKNVSEGKVIAYICQKVGSSWKCGCGDKVCREAKWQVQTFETPSETQEAQDTETDTNDDTENTTQNNVNDNLEYRGTPDEGLSYEELEQITIDNLRELGVYKEISEDINLYYSSKPIGHPGEKLVISGDGFEKTPISEVLWDGEVMEKDLISYTGSELTITIPDITPGKYLMEIKEGDVVSDPGLYIWIQSREPHTTPRIDRISTKNISQNGGTVTIYGDGFALENNDVYTSLGEYLRVDSEDGKTLQLDFKTIEEKPLQYDEEGNEIMFSFDVQARIFNIYGASNVVSFAVEY